MQKVKTEHLTTQNIDLLVAKLEGVEVEIYKSKNGDEFVTQRLPFSPEGPANVFDSKCHFMFLFYQPTKNWEIAGPIIQRERIFICHSNIDNEDGAYSWAFYPDDDGADVLNPGPLESG